MIAATASEHRLGLATLNKKPRIGKPLLVIIRESELPENWMVNLSIDRAFIAQEELLDL